MNRRDFLKQGTAIIATAAIISLIPPILPKPKRVYVVEKYKGVGTSHMTVSFPADEGDAYDEDLIALRNIRGMRLISRLVDGVKVL